MLEVEYEVPNTSACECCGGATTTVTRFVSRDGNAYAVYVARFSDNHPEGSVLALISIGGWGGDSSERVAFALDLRVVNKRPGVMVVDARETPWGNEGERLGRMLDRASALAHPRSKEAFAISDTMWSDDPVLRPYFLGRSTR